MRGTAVMMPSVAGPLGGQASALPSTCAGRSYSPRRPVQQPYFVSPSSPRKAAATEPRSVVHQRPLQTTALGQGPSHSYVPGSPRRSDMPLQAPQMPHMPQLSPQPSEHSCAPSQASQGGVSQERGGQVLAGYAGLIDRFRETVARATEELSSAHEDAAREERDRHAATREICDDLASEQERVSRIASSVEQVLVDLRTGAAEMRRRNASLREELTNLTAEVNTGLKTEREGNQEGLGRVEARLAKIEDLRLEEQQDREVHAAMLRNELITTMAARVQQEAGARVEMLGLTGEVNMALQVETRERVQRDQTLEVLVEDVKAQLSGTKARCDELQRTLGKEMRERERASEEQREDFSKLRARLSRCQRDYESLVSNKASSQCGPSSQPSSVHGGNSITVMAAANPLSLCSTATPELQSVYGSLAGDSV